MCSIKHLTLLADFNYLHYAIALIDSITPYLDQTFIINFLALDHKTKQIIESLKNKFIVVNTEDDLNFSDALNDLKEKNRRYYLWSLASYYTNYIIKKHCNCESVMYIDSDIFFHKNINILYSEFKENDVGIFAHRFTDKIHLENSGKYNVGVVYFKNSEKGKKVLEWWTDAVVNMKYSEMKLNTCGDQKYLNYFTTLCEPGEIYIDEHIGHGAPWNWASYDLSRLLDYEVIYKGEVQELVFTHFSKFKCDFKNKCFHIDDYSEFTNNGKIYKHQSLLNIHILYFNKLLNIYNNIIQKTCTI
jgi:hypothetical protein